MREIVPRTALLVCLLACHHKTKVHAGDFDLLTTDLPAGISDLAVDERDHLWAIAEREPVVAEDRDRRIAARGNGRAPSAGRRTRRLRHGSDRLPR